MKSLWGMLPLLMGCPPVVPEDTDETGETDTDAPPEGPTAVITTVAADYSVGALAEVGVDGLEVSDNLVPITTDPGVIAEDGKVVVLGRYGFDTVRVYAEGEYSAPEVEFSTGEGSNPQDVAICADTLFVSLYGTDSVAAYELDGTAIGTTSLEEYADEDGIPEASSIVEIDGVIYVALNLLDQTGGFQASGPGQVVGIDCETRVVTEAYEVGPNPSIEPYPGDPGKLLVRTGVYYTPEFEISLDGALSVLSLADGEVEELLDEATLGANVTEIAANDAGAVVLTQDELGEYSIWCLDTEGQPALLDTTFSYLNDAAVSPDGEAWVAAREGFGETPTESGVAVYDLPTCTAVNEGDWVSLALPPYNIAFY